jgi:hypothetical protein
MKKPVSKTSGSQQSCGGGAAGGACSMGALLVKPHRMMSKAKVSFARSCATQSPYSTRAMMPGTHMMKTAAHTQCHKRSVPCTIMTACSMTYA